MDTSSTNITFSSLDPSQKRALEEITTDTTSNLHIVYGPPGTGKSQLVVSLLERLAANHQKVLFVSQNTEALRVIERMIRKTEQTIGYPTDESYFSLLDMCLMLYEPAHRRLKYLREHSATVSSKITQNAKELKAPTGITYQLKYTSLSHDENYDITSGEIGFDELMAYYLKYVSVELAPEVLSEFEKVDVRRVFNLIDNYKQPEVFGDFVHPRRELCLLATNNPELNLPVVREQVQKLKHVVQSDQKTSTIGAKVGMDVVDYIDLLLVYAKAAEYINVYAVSTTPKGLSGLVEALEAVAAGDVSHREESNELNQKLDDAKRDLKYAVNNLTLETPRVELKPVTVRAAEENLDQTLTDMETISDLIKELNSFARGLKYSSPRELQINLAKALIEEYHGALDFIKENDAEDLFTLNATKIHALHKDLHEYFAISGPKKLLRRVPESFVALDLRNHQWMECYRDTLMEAIGKFSTVLQDTDRNIQWLLSFARQDPKHNLSKLGVNYQSTDELLHYLAVCSKLYLLLEKYDLAGQSYEEITEAVQANYTALKTLQELWLDEANGRMIFQNGLKHFLVEVDKNRLVIELESEISEKMHDYERKLSEQRAELMKFLKEACSADEFADYVGKVLAALKPLMMKFDAIITKLELPLTDVVMNRDYLNNVREALLEVNQADCLSDHAFEIESRKTLDTWLDKILCLEQYSNDTEIATFVEHNNFIDAIYTALGEANRAYLTSILEQEELSFQDFTARLVSALVHECYGRSPISARKHIADDTSFFDEYATYLKNQKLRHYANGLREMYTNCASAMRELARQETMRDATKSTFEKFRANTAKILEAFPIVCATPKEVAKYLAPEKGEFDYVIFDEASQLLPGQALPSIFRAKKAVIIGDPHQMPPSLNLGFGMTEVSDDEEDDIGESILDLARKQPQLQHHLKVHYRSRYNKLFEPSRRAIYAREGIEPIFEAEPSRRAPIAIEDNLGDDDVANFGRICESAREYLKENPAAKDELGAVFCILFARAEVLTQFKRYLAEDETARHYNDIVQLYNQDRILLSTVTNCQGIEGLYTIVYLQYYTTPAAMWFFKEGAGAYKRLNVSITRQREGLKLLLANPESAWIMACDNKINNPNTGPNARLSAELMKSLLENAGEDTDFLYLERTLGDNINHFDSPLTEQLYHKLEKHYGGKIGKTLKIYSEVGWNLLLPNGDGIDQNERNVGFRIDLGVYSIPRQKFILGIEMDGATYHTGYYKEHSDYNRQQVLEAKGWTIHRIWSTNWLNDEAREFERLVAKIDDLLGK